MPPPCPDFEYKWSVIFMFMIGAATSAYQVEGNNACSDFWVMEQAEQEQISEEKR